MGEAVKSPGITVVHFWATWCPNCQAELKEGWRLLVNDPSVSISVSHLTFINSLILVIGMLAPGYVSRVLGIRPDDAVYVMAPAGIGMLLGSYLSGYAVDYFTTVTNGQTVRDWYSFWMFSAGMSAAILLMILIAFRTNEKIQPKQA